MRVSLLRCESLTKTYASGGRELTVLSNITFEVEAGAFVAILGPSGSGKSTLLGLLAGLDRPTAGSVYLDGVALHDLSEDGRARLRGEKVGFVFQSFHLIPTLTALENVQVPLELRGRNARRRAEELLERVGLGKRAHHYPAQLSGGEQQRVALARAFSHGPRIVFADEPTGNLDAATGATVIELLARDEPRARHHPGAGDPRPGAGRARAAHHPPGRRRRGRGHGDGRRVTGLAFVAAMARREARGQALRLWPFVAAVAVGVAALVAINSFTENLQDTVRDQARALLGADLAFSSSRAFPPRADELIAELGRKPREGPGRRGSRASRPWPTSRGRPGTRLVQVAAVEEGYPFYGRDRDRPAGRMGPPGGRALRARRPLVARGPGRARRRHPGPGRRRASGYGARSRTSRGTWACAPPSARACSSPPPTWTRRASSCSARARATRPS